MELVFICKSFFCLFYWWFFVRCWKKKWSVWRVRDGCWMVVVVIVWVVCSVFGVILGKVLGGWKIMKLVVCILELSFRILYLWIFNWRKCLMFLMKSWRRILEDFVVWILKIINCGLGEGIMFWLWFEVEYVFWFFG